MPTASSNVRIRGQSGKHMLVLSSSQFDPNETSALDRRRPDRSRLRLHQALPQPSKSSAANSRINSNLMGKSAWAATSQVSPEGCAIRRAGEVEMDTPIKAKPAPDLRH